MPNRTRVYGGLEVTLTSQFESIYSDRGTGAKYGSVEIHHPKAQGDLRPLESFAHPDWEDQNGKRATLLVGNAPGNHKPAVSSPVGYTVIWTEWGSGGKMARHYLETHCSARIRCAWIYLHQRHFEFPIALSVSSDTSSGATTYPGEAICSGAATYPSSERDLLCSGKSGGGV
jgi:hypothetical protein